MKKYKFKLEGLLKLREFKEHSEKLKLAEINKVVDEVKRKIKKTKQDIKTAYESAEKMTQEGSSGQMISFYPSFIRTKRELLNQLQEQLERLESDHEYQVQCLSEAQGETKVIDKMKDKDFEKFKKDRNKKEQEKIDDIINSRYVIKKSKEKKNG